MSVKDDIKKLIDSLKLEEGEKITSFFSADYLPIPDTTDLSGDSRDGKTYSSEITEHPKEEDDDPDVNLGGDDPDNDEGEDEDNNGDDKEEGDEEDGDGDGDGKDGSDGDRELKVGDRVRVTEGVNTGRVGVITGKNPEGVWDITVE